MPYRTVQDVMTANPLTVGPTTALKDVVGILIGQKTGCVPVVNLRGKAVGVVTDTDLLRREDLKRDPDSWHSRDMTYRTRRDLATAETAGELMSTDLVTVPPGAPVTEAARLTERHDVTCLLVIDEGGKLLGVAYPRDLLRGFLRPDEETGAAIADAIDDSILPVAPDPAGY